MPFQPSPHHSKEKKQPNKKLPKQQQQKEKFPKSIFN
jgi:hypothetical protein